jgi:hypothetical protein
MTGISLHMQWHLTSQLDGSVSQREQLIFVMDQTPRPSKNFFSVSAKLAGICGEDRGHLSAAAQVQHLRHGVLQQGGRQLGLWQDKVHFQS